MNSIKQRKLTIQVLSNELCIFFYVKFILTAPVFKKTATYYLLLEKSAVCCIGETWTLSCIYNTWVEGV